MKVGLASRKSLKNMPLHESLTSMLSEKALAKKSKSIFVSIIWFDNLLLFHLRSQWMTTMNLLPILFLGFSYIGLMNQLNHFFDTGYHMGTRNGLGQMSRLVQTSYLKRLDRTRIKMTVIKLDRHL